MIIVISPSFDPVVVDADTLVRVSNGHIDCKFVVEVGGGGAVCGGGGGEVELCEGGVGDVELNHVGTEYEPDD